jgi:hypothetical protein
MHKQEVRIIHTVDGHDAPKQLQPGPIVPEWERQKHFGCAGFTSYADA